MLTGFISLINIKEVSNSFFPCIESYGSVFWFTGFVLLCFRGLFHLVNSDSVVLMSLTTAIASNITVFSDIITPFFLHIYYFTFYLDSNGCTSFIFSCIKLSGVSYKRRKVCQDLYSTQTQNTDSNISHVFKFLVI